MFINVSLPMIYGLLHKMHTLNIKYYHNFIDVLMKVEVQERLIDILRDLQLKKNKFHNVYTNKYSADEYPDKYETVYATIIDDTYVILLYDDNYISSETFFVFNIVNNVINEEKISLYGFGRGPIFDEECFDLIGEKTYEYEYNYHDDHSHDDPFLTQLLQRSFMNS